MTLGAITCLAGVAHSQTSSPPSLPDIQYRLTARLWLPLNTPRDVYLDKIEGIVRYEATLQNGSGAIIDPVENFTHNWRSYAMKGQWYRFHQGLVSSNDAMTFIEDGWINTQRSRSTTSHGPYQNTIVVGQSNFGELRC